MDLLRRIESGEPVRIEIQSYDLGEDRTYLQNAKDTLIQLDIDNSSVTTAYYRENDVSLMSFLTMHANMTMSGNVIHSIAVLENTQRGFWEIIVPSKEELPSNISDVVLDKGDHVVLIYQKHSDNDAILDRTELLMGLNESRDDTDNDGLNDDIEVYGNYGTDPLSPDTDFDGLNDGEEIRAGVDGYTTDPAKPDSDNDGLNDYQELLHGTNPVNPDTDADGLTDSIEITQYHTDPKKTDTDSDLLTDGNETKIYHTDPLDADSDDDGLSDVREVSTGSSPLNRDTDNDTYPDGVDIDPLHDIWLHINLTRMEANNHTDVWPWNNAADVYFLTYVYDGRRSLLYQNRTNCPDNTNSYVMNRTVSYNKLENYIDQEKFLQYLERECFQGGISRAKYRQFLINLLSEHYPPWEIEPPLLFAKRNAAITVEDSGLQWT